MYLANNPCHAGLCLHILRAKKWRLFYPDYFLSITVDRIRNAKWAFQPLTLSICSQLTEICLFPAHAMIFPAHATINTTICTSPTICIMRSSVKIYSPKAKSDALPNTSYRSAPESLDQLPTINSYACSRITGTDVPLAAYAPSSSTHNPRHAGFSYDKLSENLPIVAPALHI